MFWKLYFWFIALLTLASFALLLHPEYGTEFDLSTTGHEVLAILELIGLYGYVFSKRIGKPWSWHAVLAISIGVLLFDVLYVLEFNIATVSEDQSWSLGATGIAALLLLPLWLALYRLGRNGFSKNFEPAI